MSLKNDERLLSTVCVREVSVGGLEKVFVLMGYS